MVLTVTEDTPADMLAGSMELLVQLPHDHYLHTQRVTVLRSTPMMDLLVQIATAHKLTASNYTLQAIGEHGLVLPHHPNTPIGALDALQVKLLTKQGTYAPRKVKQANQPFETTFRLQVHLPRNQLYVSRVSPRMNLGEILDEVCREKNLDSSKYELRHPTNLEETLDLSLSLQDYQLQEVTLYAKQTRNLGQTLSTQDILALQRQEERRRQQTKQSVFGSVLKKSKESSLSMDSLGGRSVSPARSDETTRSISPLQPPARPQRKRRPAPKPPADLAPTVRDASGDISEKDKMVINHSRNSSDSSGYHEASVLSDNPDTTARLPETLPRRSRMPGMSDTARRLAQTSQSSKSLGNLAVSGGTLTRGISNTCLSSVGLRKKRAAPPPPAFRSLSSAISIQTLERIVDSEESLTSDIDPSKSPSDIGAPSKASSDIDCFKANSDICISTQSTCLLNHKPKSEIVMCKSNSDMQQNCTVKMNFEARSKSNPVDHKLTKMDTEKIAPIEVALKVEQARIAAKRGKLACILNILSHSSKSQDSLRNFHQVSESGNMYNSNIFRAVLHLRKYKSSISNRGKLYPTSQRLQSCNNPVNADSANYISVGIITKDHIQNIDREYQASRIYQKSYKNLTRSQIKLNLYENSKKSIFLNSHNRLVSKLNKFMCPVDHCTKECNCFNKQLTFTNLENRYNLKLLDSSICDKRGRKVLTHRSFQDEIISKETKLANLFKEPELISLQNVCSNNSKMPVSLEFTVTELYNYTSSIISNKEREACNPSEKYVENDLFPPPLSTLQIFVISTKPLNIQIMPTDSVPGNMDELPSLPIINHTRNKLKEKKLSILEPPPPGLVNRQESNESWNRFLVQLNSILENRTGKFV